MSQDNQYAKTDLPRGIDSIIQICEDLRDRNTDGYVPFIGGLLARIKGFGPSKKGTTCSPFTGTVMALAFDPDYPKDDTKTPYTPKFDGGKDLPFVEFYRRNNNSHGVDAVVKYGLGREIPPQKMRRGDLLEINWQNKGGHSVFCWDVHLDGSDPDAKVDCFQIIGSNGSAKKANGPGVTIHGCTKPVWLEGDYAVLHCEMVEKEHKKKKIKDGKPVIENGKPVYEIVKQMEPDWTMTKRGSLSKAKDKSKIFVDSDDIVETGTWWGLPGVPNKSIKLETFRKRPDRIIYSGTSGTSVASVRCARFNYDESLTPKPFCMKDDPPAPKQANPIGHAEGPVTPMKGPNVKSDPEAPNKVKPKPVTQDKNKPLEWQRRVEFAMRQFYRAGWIESDPGDSEDINDSKTQAAIKEFQTKFKLDPNGIPEKLTREAIEKQLPACCQQPETEVLLATLYRGKKLSTDPGSPDGINDAKTRAAVEEFQKTNGLDATGLPDADTRAKLFEVLKEHESTTTKPGLEPTLHHLYWVSSPVAPGGSAKLRLHFRDLIIGQECPIHLTNEVSGKEVESSVKMKVEIDEAEAAVPIPAEFGSGSRLMARVTAAIADEGELEATTPAPLEVRAESSGPIAVVNGDDVYLDPPVRLWPQYDPRWKRERIGGPKTGKLIDWINNGCNASTAAMTLRWFAEDCKAGKIPFPTKPGGRIDRSWYGLRMAESFWPNADPPGKVELTPGGTIHFRKIYAVAAHYLKTGEIQRSEKGDVIEPSGPTSRYVAKKPNGGWLGLIREMLKQGPVIVGLGAPAGHFVLAHGVIGEALLIADPGGVLYQAHNGGTAEIANWKNKDGYLDGQMDKEKVRAPSPSQWPGGKAPGQEGDLRSYNLISGQFLNDLLEKLISVTSLTFPEGPKLGGAAEPAPTDDSLEVFFKFQGNVGESNAARAHTYTAYKVKGKSKAYLVKGRLMVDVDGAPNCYHPDDKDVRTDYLKVDLMAHQGALDWKRNGGHPGNWFGVVTDDGKVTGNPIIQGPNDPFPGFYVSSTSLVDQTKLSHDTNRYVDARKIPYIAFPGQVYSAKGPRFTQVGEGPTGEIGDFLTVVNPDADGAHKYCHAVFGDMGGRDDPHFGEGSPALAQKVHAAGVVEAKLLYIIYPHSGAGRYTIPSLEEIQKKGEDLFKEWGGIEEVNRVLPMMK
jgi:peptidoglycan hydrolase-like protein with peptidoglycan-binding domain